MIVCGEKLWRVLFDYGVRGRLLQSVKALYEGGRAMESEGLGVRSRSGLGVSKGACEAGMHTVALAFHCFY